ncbi:MAG: histidinol dehydrogenase [Dehalococcoidia bacterium]|nr:histidinol dehydrogenase [Dehalococcoidia bacterium]
MKLIRGFAECRGALSRRAVPQKYSVSPRLAAALTQLFGTEDVQQAVAIIIERIREHGDDALKDFSRRIDRVELDSLEVPQEEMRSAAGRIAPKLLDALKAAAQNIEHFHRRQFEAWECGAQKMSPDTVFRVLSRVGLYVPGGTASYPSSVLMTVLPAKAAGVKEIIVCTPPAKDGKIPDMTLAAAYIAGVDKLFAIGGAQAIAALAFGTKIVPAVDKICGPGNIFVMLAKKQLFGTVDIDGLQGPSEVLVLADASANIKWCAADILAQAEHDAMSQSILLTTSEDVAEQVIQEVTSVAKTLSRRDIIEESLTHHAVACVVDNMEQAIELANLYAPEHLCIFAEDSHKIAQRISHAGCIFVGEHPTVAMGDYIAGPSHALPTSGTARFAAPLNTTDFVRLMNVVSVDAKMYAQFGPQAAVIAEAEGLTAHVLALTHVNDEANR